MVGKFSLVSVVLSSKAKLQFFYIKLILHHVILRDACYYCVFSGKPEQPTFRLPARNLRFHASLALPCEKNFT